MSVMYEVPSRKDVARVVITEDVVHSNVNPTWCRASRGSSKNDGRHEKSA